MPEHLGIFSEVILAHHTDYGAFMGVSLNFLCEVVLPLLSLSLVCAQKFEMHTFFIFYYFLFLYFQLCSLMFNQIGS